MPEQVAIIREGRVPLPVSPGAHREFVELTYQATGMPPRVVYIDPDHDSPEERIRVIAEDLKQARSFTPPTLEIPG